jgi:predicted flap endonuclease-1-like 5' DNA nuclease
VTKLETIEGIGPVYAARLRKGGVATVEALLEQGATPLGRLRMEQKTGIGHALILEWVNVADLMCIKGIGEQYSGLLGEAGVDTVRELQNRVPERLYKAVVRTNEAKRLVRRLPSLGMVRDWVGQARALAAGRSPWFGVGSHGRTPEEPYGPTPGRPYGGATRRPRGPAPIGRWSPIRVDPDGPVPVDPHGPSPAGPEGPCTAEPQGPGGGRPGKLG